MLFHPWRCNRILRMTAGGFTPVSLFIVVVNLTAGYETGGTPLTIFDVAANGLSVVSAGLFAWSALRKRPRATAFNGRRAPRPPRAVACASRLLPAGIRDEYQEEWAAWMLDLRIDGTRRLRRWLELLTIVLIAAPRLAISLRTAAQHVVDQ